MRCTNCRKALDNSTGFIVLGRRIYCVTEPCIGIAFATFNDTIAAAAQELENGRALQQTNDPG